MLGRESVSVGSVLKVDESTDDESEGMGPRLMCANDCCSTISVLETVEF